MQTLSEDKVSAGTDKRGGLIPSPCLLLIIITCSMITTSVYTTVQLLLLSNVIVQVMTGVQLNLEIQIPLLDDSNRNEQRQCFPLTWYIRTHGSGSYVGLTSWAWFSIDRFITVTKRCLYSPARI